MAGITSAGKSGSSEPPATPGMQPPEQRGPEWGRLPALGGCSWVGRVENFSKMVKRMLWPQVMTTQRKKGYTTSFVKKEVSTLCNHRVDFKSLISACACMLSHIWLFCDPMDCSLPGLSVHRISQARILERVAICSCRGYSQSRDWTCVSCIGRQIL